MYLRNLHIRNIGPLETLDLEFELQENSNPKPIILVGKNGSGKTYTLSYIADAFFEIAKKEFSDVVSKTASMDSPYFRMISPRDINTKTQSQSAAAYLKFTNDQNHKEVHYCEKIGSIDSAQDLMNLYTNKINDIDRGSGNQKKFWLQKKILRNFFLNTIAFFPSFRKIVPHWLNVDAQIQEIFDIEQKFGGNLDKEIMCIDTFKKNIQWMLDVILDSAILPAELDFLNEGERKQAIQDKNAINNSYRNINKIFQTVLDNDELYLKTGWRNNSLSRLSLSNRSGIVIPTLEQLSTGQLILLNLFFTIIRHADYTNINNSILLENIEGMIVVDEIDAHLHSKHQSEFYLN